MAARAKGINNYYFIYRQNLISRIPELSIKMENNRKKDENINYKESTQKL